MISKLKVVFMVAEKPSLAKSLAQILSSKQCSSRKGSNGACSVHEWNGDFRSEDVHFKMTSVCGHVMNIDFGGKFNNWDLVDPAELFKCPTVKNEATPKLRMVDFLAKEARGADYMVLWLDCDKEGENICFEVIDAVKHVMNVNYSKSQTIFRAKFSSITEKDIKEAMNCLVEPNLNESMSVEARQQLDLRIGCAFTRFQTKFFHGKYGDLDSSVVSYGPCQTPTLGFCVERHDIIKSFKPEKYYVVQVKVAVQDSKKPYTLLWNRQRCFDKEVAGVFLKKIQVNYQAMVLSVISKEKTKARPKALNTVELLRICSSWLSIGPHHTMQIAERLYIQGYISYPRTETTQYAEGFDLICTLKMLEPNPTWGSLVREVLSIGPSRPKEGHDVGDHPPITPTALASKDHMDHESWQVYEYIVKHFIATMMPDCKYLVTTVQLEINQEHFSLIGNRLISSGFTAIMDWQSLDEEQSLPTLKEGDSLRVVGMSLVENQTSPPGHLTESELITLMEKHAIGTDASIAVHINNICQRNYVNIAPSDRRLVPTSLGIVLVHGYHKIDPDLVLPTMRSAVEEQLNLIASGNANFDDVLQHTLEVFMLKFQYFVTNIAGMDELFEVNFSAISSIGKPFSRCGKCHRYLKLLEMRPMRLYCSTCEETLAVPQNGQVRLFGEKRCPLDDFQLLQWSEGPIGQGYVFCPYCYNNAPFPDMPAKPGCHQCTHPTCEYGQGANGVSLCMECPDGILVLNKSSFPKWRIGCNKCDVVINVFDHAIKVQVLSKKCEMCGSQKMSIKYKEGESKLAGDKCAAVGCVFCSELFAPLVNKHHAKAKPGIAGISDRGRGGRSRGGRRPRRGERGRGRRM